jgi:catechol 2,3-dioxygenase-like lactoylglutathione lyase family enzyme
MASDMLGETKAYSGFAVDDLERAREFYAGTLGLRTSVEHGLMWLHLAGGRDALVYPRPDATPASYTILNFGVDDIEAAVDALAARGVRFECSEDVQQDERGSARGHGPDIAWFTDPADNLLAVLHEA